jgi:hypothetical protein
MLKIYSLAVDQTRKFSIDLVDNQLSVKVIDDSTNGIVNECSPTLIESYHSYGLFSGNFVERVPSTIFKELDQVIHAGSLKLVNYLRLGYGPRESFMGIADFWSHNPLGQVDTGLYTDQEKDIVITVFGGWNPDSIVNSSIPYEVRTPLPADTFHSHKSNARWTLWDRYAVGINGLEYWADQNGIRKDTNAETIAIPTKECLEFNLQKYTSDWSTKLERPVDCNELTLETTCGLLRTTRVPLVEGKAKFHLYPFGHLGEFKIKVGWRWYPVWDEYKFTLI